jgi:hypothetical protein
MQSTGAKPKLDPTVHMKIKTAATFAQAVVRARVERREPMEVLHGVRAQPRSHLLKEQ